MDERKDCYENLFSVKARCDECAFAVETSSRCMCPAIYENPPMDSYFKTKFEPITQLEKETIEKWTA